MPSLNVSSRWGAGSPGRGATRQGTQSLAGAPVKQSLATYLANSGKVCPTIGLGLGMDHELELDQACIQDAGMQIAGHWVVGEAGQEYLAKCGRICPRQALCCSHSVWSWVKQGRVGLTGNALALRPAAVLYAACKPCTCLKRHWRSRFSQKRDCWHAMQSISSSQPANRIPAASASSSPPDLPLCAQPTKLGSKTGSTSDKLCWAGAALLRGLGRPAQPVRGPQALPRALLPGGCHGGGAGDQREQLWAGQLPCLPAPRAPAQGLFDKGCVHEAFELAS